MAIKYILFLFLLFVVAACSPVTTEFPPSVTSVLISPTATAALPVDPTQTTVPTVIPIKLPVDRFTGLPNLSPLTSENIKDLREVATSNEAQLIQVKISQARDRAAFVFGNGIQLFDLPGLSPHPFQPFELSNVGRRRIFELSPNALQLAVISKKWNIMTSNQIVIWNLKTRKEICTLSFDGYVDQGDSGPLIMQFFPDINLFLFSGQIESGNGISKEVRLVDLSNCQIVFQFQPRLWPLLSVSPDGGTLVYVKETPSGVGMQAYLFNTRNKSETKIGDEGKLRGVGFSSDSKAVIVSNSYLTKMYDLATGEVIAQLEASLGQQNVYLYHLQDGHRILIAGNDSNKIWDYTADTNYSLGSTYIGFYRQKFDDYEGVLVTEENFWNLENKKQISLKKYPSGRLDSGRLALAISTDNRYMAVDTGYAPWRTDVFDITTGLVVASLPGERSPVVVGERFLTSNNRQSFIHRFDNGELVKTLTFPFIGGTTVDQSKSILWDAQGNVVLLDATTSETFRKSTVPIMPLAYFPIPDLYISDHMFSAWEQSLGYDPTSTLTGIGRNTALLAPDGKTAVQMSGDYVQIYKVEDGIFHPTTENLMASYLFKSYWPFHFVFSQDSAFIAGQTYKQLLIWDAKTGKQVHAFIGGKYLEGWGNNLGFSPNGKLVLVDSLQNEDSNLTILEAKTGKLVRTHSVAKCDLDVPFVFKPDGSGVFTVTPDCRIGLYSLTNWEMKTSLGGPYSGAKLALALSQDGRLLAIGHKSTFEIWDTNSGLSLIQFDLETGIENFIGDFKLIFSPDSKFLAVRYGYSDFIDTTVKLFAVPQPK